MLNVHHKYIIALCVCDGSGMCRGD